MKLPKGSCAEGHHVQVAFVLPGALEEISFTAKVLSCNSERVEVEFLQFDAKAWNSMIEKMEAVQQATYEKLRRLRGDQN